MPFFIHPGDPTLDPTASPSFVMPGLVPGIHVLNFTRAQRRGLPGQARP
jgi:hypothetical protein